MVPLSGASWDPRNLFNERYRLTLWCEHPGHAHPCGEEGRYEVSQAKKLFTTIGPYVSLVGKTLRLGAPIAAGVAGVAAAGPVGAAAGAAAVGWSLKDIKAELDMMDKVTGALLKERKASPVRLSQDRLGIRTSLEDAGGLRSLHDLLNELDPKKKWGGLRRVTTQTGDLLWVCPEHYPIYDPGLPDLSPKK